MKNLKLRTKFGVSFGIMIMIVVILGGISLWEMQDVQTEVQILTQDYLPSLKIVNEIEKELYKARFMMLRYALTRETNAFQNGNNLLQNTKQLIQNAKVIINNSKHLNELQKIISNIEIGINDYEKSIQSIEDKINTMNKIQIILDESAYKYQQLSVEFLQAHNQLFEKEIEDANFEHSKIKERLHKIHLVNELTEIFLLFTVRII